MVADGLKEVRILQDLLRVWWLLLLDIELVCSAIDGASSGCRVDQLAEAAKT